MYCRVILHCKISGPCSTVHCRYLAVTYSATLRLDTHVVIWLSWVPRLKNVLTPVKLPWIFQGAPLQITGAPGNIQGSLTGMCSAFDIVELYAIACYIRSRHIESTNRWLSARLQYLQCISNGDIAVSSLSSMQYHVISNPGISRVQIDDLV